MFIKIKTKPVFLILVAILFGLPFFASASVTNGTIDSAYKYGWSNNIGWINFAPTGAGGIYKGLTVTDSSVTGYAWSNQYGWINFGPFSNSAGDGVRNTGAGILSGYAWGANTGWINFSGTTINSSGQFTGTATGSIVGIINFNLTRCVNCGVKTDWRPTGVRPVVGSGGSGGNGLLNQPPQNNLNPQVSPQSTPTSNANPGNEINYGTGAVSQPVVKNQPSPKPSAVAPVVKTTPSVSKNTATQSNNKKSIWWPLELIQKFILKVISWFASWW